MHGAHGYIVLGSRLFWLKEPQEVDGLTNIAAVNGTSFRVVAATECTEPAEMRRAIYGRMRKSDIDRIRTAFECAGLEADNPYHPDHVPPPDVVTWVARFRSGWCPGNSDPPSVRLIYEGWRLGGGLPDAMKERTYPTGDPHSPDLGGEGG